MISRLLLATLAVLSLIAVGMQAQKAAFQGERAGAGRYQMIPPPSAGEETMQNFMWVLDSQTGQASAFRIVKMENDNKEVLGWVTQRLPTDVEYNNSSK